MNRHLHANPALPDDYKCGPHFLITCRQEGKTTAMLKWLADAPADEFRVAVFAQQAMARHAHRMAKDRDLNLHDQQFVTIRDVQHRFPRGFGKTVYGFEDVEQILAYLLPGISPAFITGSGEIGAPSEMPKPKMQITISPPPERVRYIPVPVLPRPR